MLEREEECPAECGCAGMVTVVKFNLVAELSRIGGLPGPSSLHHTPFSSPERYYSTLGKQ